MRLELISDSGDTLQEFSIPKTSGITKEQAHQLGETVVSYIHKLGPAIEAHEKKLLATCTCFWKDKPAAERVFLRTHSSECAVWDMEN